jgi:hypothetical protein
MIFNIEEKFTVKLPQVFTSAGYSERVIYPL